MANSLPCISLHISGFLFLTIICIIIIINPLPPTTAGTYESKLRNDTDAITDASIDYGNIVHEFPSSVLYPSSVHDIIDLIKSSNSRPGGPFTIAPKGSGHSVRGQAMSKGGVVVDMTALSTNGTRIKIGGNRSTGFYVDVGAEQKWIDVLQATEEYGLAPVSWTDYLHLTVGGTLSNGGISGQAFFHGPQITNVLELDVITGKGQFITCSRKNNRQLFYAVLGGLGQFGIITRARIVLDTAPTRAKWLKLLYSDFVSFTIDQEYLISSDAPNYVEGFLITNEAGLSEWNSSLSSSPQIDLVALLKEQHILYYIELAKYYDNGTAASIDDDIGTLLDDLSFIPGYIINKDVTHFDFLSRVGSLSYPQGPLDKTSHPWLVLFIPRSSIYDFNDEVLSIVIPKFNDTYPIFIIYPLKREKWDNRMSAVIPNEDVFYTLGLLHSTTSDEYQDFDKLNDEILARCEAADIQVKEYLPHYTTKKGWITHFGMKRFAMQQRKVMFDPKRILSPGQRIFN